MYPYLFNTKIPTYTVILILAFIISALVAHLFLEKRTGYKTLDLFIALGFMLVGAYIGAVILSILTNIKDLVTHNHSFIDWLTTGYVFYGGLLGGILGLFIFYKIFKLPLLPLFDYVAVVLPLGQAIGRIGCLCAGCCFGKVIPESLSWLGISFIEGTDAYLTYGSALLYPTQLFESGYCLIIFVILFTLTMKNKLNKGMPSFIYLISYCSCRFINEFFRGDFRGNTGLLSLSQYISLLILICVFVYLLVNKKQQTTQNK